MIPSESKMSFADSVVFARTKMLELSKATKLEEKPLESLTQFILREQLRIDEYIGELGRGVKVLQNIGEQSGIESIMFKNSEQGYETDKTCLYLWQIINFISIHSPKLESAILQIVGNLLNASIEYEVCLSLATMKNALITIHNIIAKIFKEKQEVTIIEDIAKWMQSILVYHFERNTNSHLQISKNFKFVKSEEQLTQETEWLAYIYHQIFSKSSYLTKQRSFFDILEQKELPTKIGYYTLHMIGNFFQDMIDKRVTTELVDGFQCQLDDIKKMYDSKGKCLIQLKISKYDLGWICKKFNFTIHNYLNLVKKYIKDKIAGNAEKQKDLLDQWKLVTDYLQQFSHVLNCILFIGGYNNKLQDFVIQILLQANHQLLKYFQLSYLLYRNIESTKYQTKVSLVVEMEKEAKRKLFALSEVETSNIEQIQIKDLQLEKVLANGQLVSLLRLLTNLVHINHLAQIPFEANPKYLHMVLSLTHDSVSQATMKQWAIMFIRNVSEWSQKLRDEIRAVKVEMKIE